ncbi:MerR family transcriptional regulator [Streptomyces niveus]|uniref:MerR family transcriptional regulator n=1 Tax=Streptomyces niveus TaxID=193462 RepID=UPI0037AB4DC3
MSTYRISQLAERSGVPATTLRFYEDAGLLPAGRTPVGYRLYGEDAVERLGFISSAKLLGLALEVREQGVCAAVRTRMVRLVAGRIAELSAYGAHLAAVQADLSGPAPEGGCTTAPAAPGPGATVTHPVRTVARRLEGRTGGVHAGRLRTGGPYTGVAAAEQDCCSFYDFNVHQRPTTLELTVRAPEAAAPLLADLFGVTA